MLYRLIFRAVALSFVLGLATGCGTDSDLDSSDGDSIAEGADDLEDSNSLCAAKAATFQTLGSANTDLPDPEVDASCDGDTIVVASNQIPDFPYIETSPGLPQESDLVFEIPATPVDADTTTAIPALGALGIAVNGIPIFGPTEGNGGDVMALGGGFSQCGGHNGPSGYHYHTFDVTGSDWCRFSESEASADHVLFGYALDGYPIYSGNFQFTSSYELTDADLFASDTWAAHTYVEGLGELDECNGRTDADGNYAYYTTETFPYIMGCFRGEVTIDEPGGGPQR
ncbi:MAG: YHYH protein [Myxococcota bacterium]